MKHRHIAVGCIDAPDLHEWYLTGGWLSLQFLLEGAHGPERLGVVLLGVRKHGAGVGFLHQIAIAQHHDLIGHLRHDRQIVCDVDGCGVELLHDIADGCQHLDLGCHVQCGGRLVEDYQIGAG